MALIPPSGSSILNITSGSGSGIVANNTISGTQLTSGLVAGTNVSLTPVSNFGGKGLRIDAVPGSSGVASVTAGNAYITVGGTSINPTIANNGVQTLSAGTGISVGGTANQPTVSNTGVLGLTAGNAGIAVGGTTQNPTVSNQGVLGVTASGAGIAVSGTAQNPNIQNTGVTSLVAGSNITLSGSTGAVTISASAAPSSQTYGEVVVTLNNATIPNNGASPALTINVPFPSWFDPTTCYYDIDWRGAISGTMAYPYYATDGTSQISFNLREWDITGNTSSGLVWSYIGVQKPPNAYTINNGYYKSINTWANIYNNFTTLSYTSSPAGTHGVNLEINNNDSQPWNGVSIYFRFSFWKSANTIFNYNVGSTNFLQGFRVI